MSYVDTLHAAHKARLRRFAARAYIERQSGQAYEPHAPIYQKPASPPQPIIEPPGWNFQYEYAWHLEMIGVEIQDFNSVANGIRVEDIQRATASYYNILRMDMLSSRRTANLVRPRQVAMYLAKIMTTRSLPDIGRRFGGRDHTTVLHAIRKIAGQLEHDTELAGAVCEIRQFLEK